ncbi:MAG: hypothetical protein GXC76_08765 [Rhodanobacteraceae bacterium]|nr:hypothetical protein [Rhodanobacteraceae bacterium]
MSIMRHSVSRAWCAAALLALAAFAGPALADPPDRVARVSFLRGNVSFQPAGDNRWVQVSLNRPLVTGDQLYTDRDSRAELDVGGAAVRLDERTSFSLLNLDDNLAQIELTEGVLRLSVRRLASGQSYEVDTPTLAFVADQPGDYRIDIAPQGDSTMVTVFAGGGDVYGQDNASYSVRAGNSYRFNDSALRDYEVLDLPRPDDFDRWVDSRSQRYERSVSARYVSDSVIGYADLDDYGSWSTAPEYGAVWYPSSVSVGWAPYRNGYWSWVDPWGWTWIDAAPWGFAPFHYGRWAYIGNRWGWCPGPRHVASIYAPAMVAFVGGGGWGASISIGGGGPVGWFPLGPRDVYVPWYRASRDYFTNVNVRNTTIINNTYITNVYNDYSRGRPVTGVNYAYRANAAAFTAVPRDAFVGGRPVANARVQVNAGNLRNAQVVSQVAIAPTRASFVAANARAATALPREAALDRGVIARTAPPPRPAPIATRLQAIERNNARPLDTTQLREIARPAAGEQGRPSRVQVVGRGGAETPPPLPARGAAQRPAPGAERVAPEAVRGRAEGAGRAPVTAPAGERAQPGMVAPRGEQAPAERGTLPSSRFAPHAGGRTAPAPERGNAVPQERGRPALERGAAQPQERAAPQPRNEPVERGGRSTISAPRGGERQQPVERATPAPVERQAPPERAAPQRNEPVERGGRSTISAPRGVERQQPVERAMPAPVERQAPPRNEQRAMPQPRHEPAPVERQAPQQRAMPQPRYEPAPMQQRSAPAPMERQAPQPRGEQRQAPPQQRGAPPERKKKDDDGGR